MTEATVAALAQLVGGRLIGDGSRRILGLGDLRTAGADCIGFVRDARYHAAAEVTRAGALLAGAELSTSASQIVVDDVNVAYAKIALHFHPIHAQPCTASIRPPSSMRGQNWRLQSLSGRARW